MLLDSRKDNILFYLDVIEKITTKGLHRQTFV